MGTLVCTAGHATQMRRRLAFSSTPFYSTEAVSISHAAAITSPIRQKQASRFRAHRTWCRSAAAARRVFGGQQQRAGKARLVDALAPTQTVDNDNNIGRCQSVDATFARQRSRRVTWSTRAPLARAGLLSRLVLPGAMKFWKPSFQSTDCRSLDWLSALGSDLLYSPLSDRLVP